MILQEKDTICAVSTPAGVGGVAVIRVSGPDAISISDSVLSMSKPLAEKKANTVSFGKLVKRVRSEELGVRRLKKVGTMRALSVIRGLRQAQSPKKKF